MAGDVITREPSSGRRSAGGSPNASDTVDGDYNPPLSAGYELSTTWRDPWRDTGAAGTTDNPPLSYPCLLLPPSSFPLPPSSFPLPPSSSPLPTSPYLPPPPLPSSPPPYPWWKSAWVSPYCDISLIMSRDRTPLLLLLLLLSIRKRSAQGRYAPIRKMSAQGRYASIRKISAQG